ncbi:MAG: helix-turn-helix domain-containing protein [Solirubrobacteraceae bacterium]
MERTWLADQLAAGRSIEAIARDIGRDPSTVSYWVGKHGLVSAFAARHAARGGIALAELEALVLEGLTVRAIAERLELSYATVQHWLKRHGLKTRRGAQPRGGEARTVERECPVHGRTTFVKYSATDHHRCELCRKGRVVARRRKVKALLVEEAGGGCVLCGYNRYPGALQFHHLDPAMKAFGLGMRGLARSLEQCREEARKCVLLCANCHAEVEGGVVAVR